MNDHKDVPQGLKPSCRVARCGTAEAVPFVQGTFPSEHGTRRTGVETAGLSTTLPRISCKCWVALANIMRLSLKKGAHAALSSGAWQEIRVRSGRDDKSVVGRDSTFPGKVSGTADPSAPPRFPVETCGFGQLLVVLLRENHISGTGESGEVGNPGTLGMTKGRANVPWKVAAGPMRYAFQDL